VFPPRSANDGVDADDAVSGNEHVGPFRPARPQDRSSCDAKAAHGRARCHVPGRHG
jgi:hypothetical protein